MSRLTDDAFLSRWFEFWTADGYLWRDDGTSVPCEDAAVWYRDERGADEWIDIGGSD